MFVKLSMFVCVYVRASYTQDASMFYKKYSPKSKVTCHFFFLERLKSGKMTLHVIA